MCKLKFAKEDLDFSTRADKMTKSLMSGKKIVHKLINSAPDFMEIQDLYLNGILEWYKHPKFVAIQNAKGEKYGED